MWVRRRQWGCIQPAVTCCLTDVHKENVTSHRYVAGKGGGLADPPERVLGIPGILRPHSDDVPLDSGWRQSAGLRGDLTSDLLLSHGRSQNLQTIYLKRNKSELIQLIPRLISLIYIHSHLPLSPAPSAASQGGAHGGRQPALSKCGIRILWVCGLLLLVFF